MIESPAHCASLRRPAGVQGVVARPVPASEVLSDVEGRGLERVFSTFEKPSRAGCNRYGIGGLLRSRYGGVWGRIQIRSEVGWERPSYFAKFAGVGTTVRSPDVTVAKI
ncbi:MAG: hypothetical protein OXH85_06165 [Truepera sp.]|nr:hypothetical protein [Truepera sp.]